MECFIPEKSHSYHNTCFIIIEYCNCMPVYAYVGSLEIGQKRFKERENYDPQHILEVKVGFES
jgi:hypothetical protein